MSQENVERFRDALQAWDEDDVERYVAATAPTLTFRTVGPSLPVDPVYQGHDGFRFFWTSFREAWERLTIDVARMEDLGDRVLALLILNAVGHGSGMTVERQIANIATFDNGLIVDLCAYSTWEEALEAAGLEEYAMSQENVASVRLPRR